MEPCLEGNEVLTYLSSFPTSACWESPRISGRLVIKSCWRCTGAILISCMIFVVRSYSRGYYENWSILPGIEKNFLLMKCTAGIILWKLHTHSSSKLKFRDEPEIFIQGVVNRKKSRVDGLSNWFVIYFISFNLHNNFHF